MTLPRAARRETGHGTTRQSSVRQRAARHGAAAGELALVLACYLAYSAGRNLAHPTLTEAGQNARAVLRLEELLHLDVETGINAALAAVPALSLAASYWYAILHYLVTPLVLAVLWHQAPARYRALRSGLLLATALALVCYLLLPVAPPRLLGGYQDVLAQTSGHGWWGTHASAPRGLDHLTNELAAMPSMHVGWALWCAVAVRSITTRTWLRRVVAAYPVITSVVVIATGNHWILDVAVGAALTAATVSAAPSIARPRVATFGSPS